MEKELEYEGEEDGSDNDYEEINSSEITKSEAEEIFELTFSLAQASLCDIVKNSQNSFFQCHVLAKVNASNMLDLKANLECYFSNLRKKNNESTQKTIENLHLQSSVIPKRNGKSIIKINQTTDFDNLSDGLSSNLFDNENKHIARNEGNNLLKLDFQNTTNSNFDNDHNQVNINIKVEDTSKLEDDFDLIKTNDLSLSYEEANNFDLLSN
jgi:hypothetical protein